MLKLHRYPERYAIASLPVGTPLPPPPAEGYYTCIVDKNEITLVTLEDLVPAEAVQVARGYRVIMLDTSFAFDVVGVLARCSGALADASIPIMAYSSYLTDIFLIQEIYFETACEILTGLTFRGG